jgi:polar amino acid transport system permease protein
VEVSDMRDIIITLLGKPGGIVVFQLLEATQFTVYLSLIAFVGGGAVASAITLLQVAPGKLGGRLSGAYIWLFQSVPLLMLLFLFGLGVPRLSGVDINPWLAASSALTLYTSAYLADVWRGAIQAVPGGQWDGGKALGFRFLPILALVILPQALRLALAPTVGFMVQIIKGTSLAYIIGFHDLMNIGKRWANAPVSGTEPFVIFPIMALIYFSLCYPLSLWARYLEKRLGTGSKTPVPTPTAA